MDEQGPRLFIFVVGQMRSADRTFEHFRAQVQNWTETKLLVQCAVADREQAAIIYADGQVDAWDPDPSLPTCLRLAWPLFGAAGREAARLKPSFFLQLVRQYRAAKLFGSQIDPRRDWILKWRPDLMLFGALDWRALLDRRKIWLPMHDNYGGFNDQCAIGPADLMLPYLTRLERLDGYFAEGGRMQAEFFLRWVLRDLPVARMALPYCIHRGTHLHPVTFSPAYDDYYDSKLAACFESVGVPVSVDQNVKPNSQPQFPRCGRYAYPWQRMLAKGFSGTRLAQKVAGLD